MWKALKFGLAFVLILCIAWCFITYGDEIKGMWSNFVEEAMVLLEGTVEENADKEAEALQGILGDEQRLSIE